MVSQDDSAYEAKIRSIDFGTLTGNQRAGRASVAVGRTNNNRMSMQVKFGTKLTLDSAAQKALDQQEIDEKFGLPDTWDRHTQTRTKLDNCFVCVKKFSAVAVFGMGDRDFYCKRCGKAVCEDCSTQKKFLSKDSKEKFRICDICDTELENVRLRLHFDRYLVLKDEQFELTESLLERIRNQRLDLQKQLQEEKLEQEKKLAETRAAIEKEALNQQKFETQIQQIKLEISLANQQKNE